MQKKLFSIAVFLLFYHFLFFDSFFRSLVPGFLAFPVLITLGNLFLFVNHFQKDFLIIHKEGILFSVFSVLFAWITIFRGDTGFTGFILWLGSLGFLALTFNNYICLKPYLESFAELVFMPLNFFVSLLNIDISGSLGKLNLGRKLSPKSFSYLRGLFFAFPILFILTILLNSADPIFSKIFTGSFSFLNNFPELMRRILVTILWLIVLLPVSLMAIKHTIKTDKISGILSGFVTEASVVIGLVIALLGWFLLVQIKYLFANVPETQLIKFGVNTYSEYVNKGFFELIFASLFVYGIVSLSLYVLKQQLYPPSQKTSIVRSWMNAKNFLLRRDFAPDEAARKRYPNFQVGELYSSGKLLRNLNLVLIGELGLLLVSVFWRLVLYQQYHGLTVARVYGLIFLGWLAIMVAILVCRHFWEKRWIMAEILGTAAVILFVGIFNVDNLVATKYPPTVNGERDESYLSDLSADGYAGWKIAYSWADQTITELKDKKEFNEEDYRRLVYVSWINNSILNHYQDLVTKYGGISNGRYEISKRYQPMTIKVSRWQDFNLVNWQVLNKMANEIPVTRLDEIESTYNEIRGRVPQKVIDNAFIDRGYGRFF